MARLVFFLVVLGGCAGPCKDGTLLVGVSLDQAASTADTLHVRVTNAGDPANPVSTLTVAPNTSNGTIEVDFSRYPFAATVYIDIAAIRSGHLVAQGSATVTLGMGCDTVPVAVQAIGGSTYAAAILADAPIVYYPLGEAASSSIARDLSGNFIDAAYTPSDQLARPGIPNGNGTAVRIVDASGALEITDPRVFFDGVHPFSLEAWATNTLGDGKSHYLFNFRADAGSASNCTYDVYMTSAPDSYSAFIEHCDETGATEMSVGLPFEPSPFFTHIVGTFDGGQLTIYVNGVPASIPLSSIVPTPMNAQKPALFIGAHDEASGALYATITQAAIYDYALTSTQVATHYGKGR